MADGNKSDDELDQSNTVYARGSRESTLEEKPLWDSYKLPEQRIKSQRDESLMIIVPLKILRLLCFGFTFAIILAGSIFSKLTLTLMATQTVPNRTMDLDLQTTNKRFVVNTGALERLGWNWALLFTLIVPEVLTFCQCFWTCIFKSYSEEEQLLKKAKENKPLLPQRESKDSELPPQTEVRQSTSPAFWMVFFTETLHILGVCLFVFMILPKLDSIKSIMFMNALSIVPCTFLIFSRKISIENKIFPVQLFLDVAAIVSLVGGAILWSQSESLWLLMAVGIMISCGWWENYIPEESNNIFFVTLKRVRVVLRNQNKRYFIYQYISLWKICLCFAFFLICMAATSEVDLLDLLPYFKDSFHDQPVGLIQTWQAAKSSIEGAQANALRSTGMLPIHLMAINIACCIACYAFGVFACKICIQEFSFSFSLSISIPISIFLMSSACSWRMEEHGFLTNIFPKYVFWGCPSGDFVHDFLLGESGWIWIFWFLSQAWVTLHIWKPETRRRAATDTLFVNPMYSGTVIDQSLIFNRRRIKKLLNIIPTLKDSNTMEQAAPPVSPVLEDMYEEIEPKKKDRMSVTVYACATMWHETPEEMIEMLKSIMRMDKYLQEQRDKGDYSSAYGFETHIFFDDAFRNDPKTKKLVVNDYVKKLVSTVGKAAAKIYESKKRDLKKPIVMVTPYGGRLIWELPGETPLIVHIKNKDKIRHKKRWSQVMYMYYLLGYIYWDPSNESYRNSVDAAANTYILALDGDIDFKPGAVTRLLDLMDNQSLGAACGRIHPIGSGPIVWYQKFEYAIGHWLQKATEHVTGCVLCSPGCFSLFRAKAVMEVMRLYASVAEEALHYLQYDQGEDRWLCTLLLKQGYRIEYSAASDAYTHAPESFGEFFTQRRRWGPSTMANVADLLKDYKATVRVNNSISTLYILYQLMMMIGTILGPGTIFLMVVGAMVAAIRISNWISLACNIVPIIIFILICFLTKDEYQIMFAMILSSAYALLMMAVLVATAIQMTEDGISSPSGIFLLALSSSFIISAILHPQEFFCLAHGFLYFLLVPSMYLLLTIYSLINMYNVSWGTREDPLKKQEEEVKKKEEELLKKKKGGAINNVTEWLGIDDKSSWLARVCQCFFCTYQKEDKATEELLLKTNETMEYVKKLEKQTNAVCEVVFRQSPSPGGKRFFEPMDPIEETPLQSVTVQPSKPEIAKSSSVKSTTAENPTQEDPQDPYWIKNFKGCDKKMLLTHEEEFWVSMIGKYLKPLIKNVESEKRATMELKELRNKVCFGFFMINALFILIVFLLQLNKETLHLDWPVDGKSNITFIPDSNRIQIDWDYLQLEPIGLVFAIFFGIILLLQFTGMLAHRFGTFSHIMADTTLSCKVDKSVEYNDDYQSFEDIEEGEEDEPEKPVEVTENQHAKPKKSYVPQMISQLGRSFSFNRPMSPSSRGSMLQRDRKKTVGFIEDLPKSNSKIIRRQSSVASSLGVPSKKMLQRRKSRVMENMFPTNNNSTEHVAAPEGQPPNGSIPNNPSPGYDNAAYEPDEQF